MTGTIRIGVEEAHRHIASGQAVLVCGYDDDAKCQQIGLDGSISLAELQSRLPALPKSQEIIFFCA
jgi:hypothetical protein